MLGGWQAASGGTCAVTCAFCRLLLAKLVQCCKYLAVLALPQVANAFCARMRCYCQDSVYAQEDAGELCEVSWHAMHHESKKAETGRCFAIFELEINQIKAMLQCGAGVHAQSASAWCLG